MRVKNMNVESVLSNFYRYNFKNLLNNFRKSELEKFNKLPVIADIYTSRANKILSPVAPQDIEEIKKNFSPEDKNISDYNSEYIVNKIDPKDITNRSDTAAYHDLNPSFFKPALSLRQLMEKTACKCRKAGIQCPYADKNAHCSALFIRCSDRHQYAVPENAEQKNLPHICLYKPSISGDYILIIDKNKTVLEFCKSTIEFFYRYDSEKIVVATSTTEASNQLDRFKIEGKKPGLIICDITLYETWLFDLLTRRNYNTEVILTREQNQNYSSNNISTVNNISQNKEEAGIVKKIIVKPFHSYTFLNSINTMNINKLLKKPY